MSAVRVATIAVGLVLVAVIAVVAVDALLPGPGASNPVPSGSLTAIASATVAPGPASPALATGLPTPGPAPSSAAASAVATLPATLPPTAASTPKPTKPPPTKPPPTKPPPTKPPPTKPPAESVVLVGAGDIADCNSNGDSATADLLDGISGTVFTLGDNAYEDGTLREFEKCYGPTWGRHRSRTRPSAGNHEYHTAGAAGYFNYFGARAGDPDTGWYAYNLGAWRIYALNSNCTQIGGCGAASAQVAWLKADIADHPKACVLAYWHHPRYSSGRHGNHPSTDGLWDALYDAGAELVLAGHDHDYERFAPMDDRGLIDTSDGIVEIVVGTGGRHHYEFETILSASRARNDTTWGVLKLTLSAGSWASRFVPVAGKTFSDSSSGTCH